MGKSRMTVLDVKASVASLRNQLLGARVANVYDIDAKTYLLKCAKAGEKTMVLLESGIRFHSTDFMRDKSNMPSGFTLKLRKHIRTKRVEEVRQIGDDRVVAFTFGAGDEAMHLVLELFAGGNIILLNHENTIMVLLRTHTDEATGARTAVREMYPLNKAPEPRCITADLLLSAVEKTADNPKLSLKDGLSKELDYGPALVEHALLAAGVDPKFKAADMELAASSPDMVNMLRAFEAVDGIILGFSSIEGKIVPGVIIRKDATDASAYDEFSPVVLRQHEGKAVVEFESFDKAMDAFFTIVEGRKIEEQKAQQKKAALSKVDRVRKAHEASVAALESVKDTQYHKAMLIEANLNDVDNAILVVNSMLSQGTDWDVLKKMIKEESRKGNPVASIIHSLKFDTNQITLQLTFGLDDLDEDSQTVPVTAVDIDLGVNAYTNAQNYYQTKKKVAAKMEKTIQNQGKALKGAERKAKQEMKNVDVKSAIQQVRRQHWFEKFIYFISSENFLVLAGRDAQQNELLVKRHMEKGDVYLHADIHGAATHIIKNHTKNPVPPLTLAQAGLACVCRSAAWDAKMVTSAYWVHPEQVSKSAPTGEYLSTGSFMIRGKKNFLPPNSLVMGFGLLFKVDESCLAHHIGERKVRGMGDADTDADSASVMGRDDDVQDDDEVDDQQEEGDVGEEGEEVQGGQTEVFLVDGVEANGRAARAGLEDHQVRKTGKGAENTLMRQDSESELSVASSSGASTVLSKGVKEAGTSLRTTADGDNLDLGVKDFDGMRIGAVSMAAFMEGDDDDDDAAANAIPDILKPTAKKEDDGKNRGQNWMTAAERKRLKKGSGCLAGPGGTGPVSRGDNGETEGSNQMDDGVNEGRAVPGAERKAGKGSAGSGGKVENGAAGQGSKEGKSGGKKDKNAPPAPPPTANKRGSNAKKKKLAKYADQDEEERLAALKMLGVKIADEEDGGEGAEGSGGEESVNGGGERERKMEPTGLAAAVEDRLFEIIGQGKALRKDFDKQTLAKLAEFSQAEALEILDRFAEAEILGSVKNKASFLSGICHRFRDRNDKLAKKEKKEIQQLNQEEGITELDDDEKEKLIDLDSFTATPLPTDILHYALPVCCPYFAMQNYKFKVKLTPAQGKKGKVAKQAQQSFLRDATARERELIKVMSDHEMVMQMISNCRIASAPSGKSAKK